MKLEFPVEETVQARSSVRTYEQRPLSQDAKKQINDYISSLSNPFSVEVRFRLLNSGSSVKGEKLGTYGIIKGAEDFIGAAVDEGELSLEALGYSFEKLILYAAALGLGTCWLGGSFKRGSFAAAMEIKDSELFPAVSPIGYAAGKKSLTETVMRRLAKSDQRKTWSELFFKNDFSQPLTEAEAGEFALPLEMLRLAPSASNKQPWRIVRAENAYHFYEAQTPGYGTRMGFDIQAVDLGIAACHFHLAALEKDLPGRFEKLSEPALELPEHLKYVFSWVLR